MAYCLRHAETFLSGRVFQRLRVHVSGAGQGLVLKTGLSGECARFELPVELIVSSIIINYSQNLVVKQQHLSPHICCGSGTQVRLPGSSASESLTGGKMLARDVLISRSTGKGISPSLLT